MLAKLTQQLVANILSGDCDITIHDTVLSGFELRVRRTGAKTWVYRYRINGSPQKRHKIGAYPGLPVAEARRLALIAAADVAKGIDLNERRKEIRAEAARARENTLGEFLDKQYEPWAKANLSTSKFQLARIRKDFAMWLGKLMTAIDKKLAEDWRTSRKTAGLQSVSINRKLQRVHAVLSKAEEWKVIDHNPLAKLKPLKCDKRGRVRFLDEDEEARLRTALLLREANNRQERERYIEHCRARGMRLLPLRTEQFTDHLQPIILVAANTGLRKSEIFHLRRRDVNLKTRWLTVVGRTSKNKQTRLIPLNQEAYETLKVWLAENPGEDDDYVFPGRKGKRLNNINHAWERLRKMAKLVNFRFHDFRHHFASRLVQSGVDLNTVRELLGHSSIDMVLRYAHLAPSGLATAVEKVARTPVPTEKAA